MKLAQQIAALDERLQTMAHVVASLSGQAPDNNTPPSVIAAQIEQGERLARMSIALRTAQESIEHQATELDALAGRLDVLEAAAAATEAA